MKFNWTQSFRVISGSPCFGKTTMASKYENVIDLRSSEFKYLDYDEKYAEEKKGVWEVENPNYLSDYLKKLKQLLQETDSLIFVVLSEKVRNEMDAQGIEFAIAYSPKDARQEIHDRCIARGNDERLIERILYWHDINADLLENDNHKKIVVKSGQFLEQALMEYQEKNLKTSDFDFELPNDLIASHPLADRDASRMLVVPENQDKHVRDFLDILHPGDVVVFNNSRVIPARFNAGAYEITLHTMESDKVWWGLAKKFNKLNIGDLLLMDDGTEIKILDKNDDSGIKIEFQTDDVFAVLGRVGKMPLPPYIKRANNDADRTRYQTVYADPIGSMAAPTAGLHFTDDMLGAIEKRGAKIVNITLHVGAGTWMPVKTDNVNEHKMHSEWGCITQTMADVINSATRVIAVGTTSLRLLESAAVTCAGILPDSYGRDAKNDSNPTPPRHRVNPFCASTDIFITPGYKFNVVDVLLTNFHLPKSTLFMLVSAFAGVAEMQSAYAHAVKQGYRFFSYGDCCLLFAKGK